MALHGITMIQEVLGSAITETTECHAQINMLNINNATEGQTQ